MANIQTDDCSGEYLEELSALLEETVFANVNVQIAKVEKLTGNGTIISNCNDKFLIYSISAILQWKGVVFQNQISGSIDIEFDESGINEKEFKLIIRTPWDATDISIDKVKEMLRYGSITAISQTILEANRKMQKRYGCKEYQNELLKYSDLKFDKSKTIPSYVHRIFKTYYDDMDDVLHTVYENAENNAFVEDLLGHFVSSSETLVRKSIFDEIYRKGFFSLTIIGFIASCLHFKFFRN